MNRPDDFLNVIFHENTAVGDEVGVCAGFERGQWRVNDFADHVMEWLPEFSLSHTELGKISYHNALRFIKKAAKMVYETDKYGNRGEFGELFLHIAIRQVYETIPAVSKIFYKTAVNETVKGFDAVHVIAADDGLELWIGETKFYTDIDRAIYDVTLEIVDHLETDYLRNEFLLIQNKVDVAWPHADLLNKLLDKNTSLDKVFKRACIPVLLTYESLPSGVAKESQAEYEARVLKEFSKACEKMRQGLSNKYLKKFGEALPVRLHVILFPLQSKAKLISALDGKLKALQA
jgi:hypothetical protein